MCGVVLAATLSASGGTLPPGLTLKAAFSAARSHAENIRIQKGTVNQAEERLGQAKGALFPTVAAIGTYTRQHAPESSAGNRAFTQPTQRNVRLNLTQPLFRGFAEYAAWRSADIQLELQRERERAEVVSLYEQLVVAYFDLLSATQDRRNLIALRDLTDRRVDDLRARVRIGRSRKGELLSAQAQAASVRAELEASEATIAQLREGLSNLTGVPAIGELDHQPAPPAAAPDLGALLKRIDFRPDVMAQRKQVETTGESVAIARAGHWPTFDFFGNYYLDRTGVLQNSKWDIGLNLSFPLFQGGVISSRVREAAEEEQKQELTASRLRSDSETLVRQRHHALSGALSRLRSIAEALSLSEENYKEQNRDYSLGLVTNLDVLQALNLYVDNQRALDRTRYEAESTYRLLLASVAEIPDAP